MAKTQPNLLSESVGPNALANTRVVLTTAADAAFITRGSIVGRKADGTFANAGVSGVTAPYFEALEDVDSTGAAKKFEAHCGRLEVPNVGGFFTIARQFKEVNFTSPEGGLAMLDGTRTFLIGLNPKTNKCIVSTGEQLPSTPAA